MSTCEVTVNFVQWINFLQGQNYDYDTETVCVLTGLPRMAQGILLGRKGLSQDRK